MILYDEFIVQYYNELLFLTCHCTFTMTSIYMYLLNTDKKKSDFKFSAVFSRISTFKKYHVHVNHMHVFHSVILFNRSSNKAGDIDILLFSCLQKSLGGGA